MGAERVQKLIAAAGITSRRKAEAMIVSGRVAVNGVVVTDLGVRADPDRDDVRVDGARLPRPQRLILALHKPRGVVSSLSDPHAERVVIDLLGAEITDRVVLAGRLDRDSEGLMILTNDGELINAMTRPGGGVTKVYEVTVRGQPDLQAIERLTSGFELDGRPLLPCRIELLMPARPGGRLSRYRMTLREGKKNQIRRMFRAIGHPVRRLVRVAIGPVRLGRLGVGAYRPLTDAELSELRRRAGVAASRAGR